MRPEHDWNSNLSSWICVYRMTSKEHGSQADTWYSPLIWVLALTHT